MLQKKVWRRADASKNLEASNEDEIGSVYGFAGAASDGEVPGNFVRVEKANIMPMRAYLKYEGSLGDCGKALCKATPIVLSDTMVVRFESPDGESTTSLVEFNRIPSVEKSSRWFDLNGRHLGKKPASRGSFYNKPSIVK